MSMHLMFKFLRRVCRLVCLFVGLQQDFILMVIMLVYVSMVNFIRPFYLATLDPMNPLYLSASIVALVLLYMHKDW